MTNLYNSVNELYTNKCINSPGNTLYPRLNQEQAFQCGNKWAHFFLGSHSATIIYWNGIL